MDLIDHETAGNLDDEACAVCLTCGEDLDEGGLCPDCDLNPEEEL